MIWEGWRLRQTGRKAIEVTGQLVSAALTFRALLRAHTTGVSILRVGVRALQHRCGVTPVGNACPTTRSHDAAARPA